MQSKYSKPAVSLLSAATTAPSPPTAFGYVDASWNSTDRIPEQFELQLWGTATDNVTAATLWRGVSHPLTFVQSAALTASSSTSLFTLSAHGYQTGDGPVTFASTGTLPGGVTASTQYWIVWASSSTFAVATSFANAMAATPVTVTLTSNGTATITLTGVGGGVSQRVYWHAVSLLNATGATTAGSIAVTAYEGYAGRFNHDSTSVAYAVSATLSAGNLSAQAVPLSAG